MSLTIGSSYGPPASAAPQPTPLEQFESDYSGAPANAADSADFSGIAQSLLQDVNLGEQAGSNIAAGQSMLQTAEGGLSNVSNQLDSMSELAMEAGDGAMNASDKSIIAGLYSDDAASFAGTLDNVSFNGQQLLSGSSHAVQFQVGGVSNGTMSATLGGLSLSSLGVPSTMMGGAGATLSALQSSLQNVDMAQAGLGASSEGLASEGDVTNVMTTNLQSSLTPYDGSDLTTGISQLMQGQVQQEAQVSVQAMENQASKTVLNLIG